MKKNYFFNKLLVLCLMFCLVSCIYIKSSKANIEEFKVADYEVIFENKEINIICPKGTDLSKLTPSIKISVDADITPLSDIEQDFRYPVEYKVTAEDGTINIYKVTAGYHKKPAKANEPLILSFWDRDSIYTITDTTISFTYPRGSFINKIKPSIITNEGNSISPDSGVVQDFTKPVRYTVTAADGKIKNYIVTVDTEKLTGNSILSFSEGAYSYIIDKSHISFTYPYKTKLLLLKPIIKLSAGATISPASGTIQDFSKPVKYIVSSENGKTKEYTVTVDIEKSPEKEILDFSETTHKYTIIGTNIKFTYPYDADLSAITPNISISEGASISPSSGQVQDLTSPLKYIVTAADGSTKTYTVTATKVKSPEKEILSFAEGANNYKIDGTLISFSYPFGTDITAIRPNIRVSKGAVIFPKSGEATDFTFPQEYIVTAADGSYKKFIVDVKAGSETIFDKQPLEKDANGIISLKSDFQTNAMVGKKVNFDGQTYIVVDNFSLKEMVKRKEYKKLSTVVTSLVTDMSSLFEFHNDFNEDISSWDVSNVTDMSAMFRDAEKFNQNIGSWDVSKVENMEKMFNMASVFNGNIGNWDVSNVRNMSRMFHQASVFAQDLNWDVSNVVIMSRMFNNALEFNNDISKWNVVSVIDMSYMFKGADKFNQDISSWIIINVMNMSGMFNLANDFNQDLRKWDVKRFTYTPIGFSTNPAWTNQPLWGKSPIK